MPSPVPNAPELPPPSPELILLLAVVQARMRALPKKERARFLADVSDALALQEASANVLRFRPRAEDRAVATSMRQARAWWAQILGVALRLEG